MKEQSWDYAIRQQYDSEVLIAHFVGLGVFLALGAFVVVVVVVFVTLAFVAFGGLVTFAALVG